MTQMLQELLLLLKITIIERMNEEFKSPERQIKTKIEEIVARDSELAQQFRK